MNTLNFRIAFFVMAILLLYAACGCRKHSSDSNPIADPFNTGSGTRNLIVVISDIHCGADISYAEINANLEPLAGMLEKVRTSANVKELVIAGDLVDEWFVPATTDTYQGKDQADFADRVAATNKVLFDKLKAIITEGIIKVTYLPGNHDMGITGASIDRMLPGVNQARDAGTPGLGTYYPDHYPQIAIEHGHRYNVFCSPDPVSNQAIAPGTILPPGYFYTRIAALHVIQKCTVPADTVPTVYPDPQGSTSQQLMYAYWQIWKASLELFPIQNHFSEKVIVTNVNGFTGNFSVDDVLPYQTTPGGTISAYLYDSIQDNWQERCTRNHVAVDIPAAYAFANATSGQSSDSMACIQYFANPASEVRLVVFGHTHNALLKTWINHSGLPSVYANSGTWIDSNPNRTTMNFVVITPQSNDPSSQSRVTLYNYQGKTCNKMDEKSLRW